METVFPVSAEAIPCRGGFRVRATLADGSHVAALTVFTSRLEALELAKNAVKLGVPRPA